MSPLAPAMPAANAVLLAVLRAGVESPVVVMSNRAPDYTKRLPFLHARTVPGGRDLHPRFLFQVVISVDAYAAGAAAAQDLAEQARLILVAAQRAQAVHAGGVLKRVATTQWPAEARDPDQPSGLARYHAKYALTIRRQ